MLGDYRSGLWVQEEIGHSPAPILQCHFIDWQFSTIMRTHTCLKGEPGTIIVANNCCVVMIVSHSKINQKPSNTLKMKNIYFNMSLISCTSETLTFLFFPPLWDSKHCGGGPFFIGKIFGEQAFHSTTAANQLWTSFLCSSLTQLWTYIISALKGIFIPTSKWIKLLSWKS